MIMLYAVPTCHLIDTIPILANIGWPQREINSFGKVNLLAEIYHRISANSNNCGSGGPSPPQEGGVVHG